MRGLVFSGGGMFGAYQVGAWKVLSRHFQPDLVVGASIGSLNAWMVAGGISPEDLEQHWLTEDGLASPALRFPRRWNHGILDPKYAYGTMQRMEAELRPVKRVGIVLRKLPHMRPHIVEGPAVTWRHLAASCAIPGVFDQQIIEGATYTDGGILDPLPLFAARDMGATRILGINCMTWGGFGKVAGAVQLRPSSRLSLRPSRVLIWNRERIEGWIARGEADAEQFIREQRLLI